MTGALFQRRPDAATLPVKALAAFKRMLVGERAEPPMPGVASRIARFAMLISVAIVPWDGTAAETADPNVFATVEDWQVVRDSFLFHKGKCTLMKAPGDTPNPQLQVHPDPDHDGGIVAVLVGLDTIRAGLKLKYDDAKADVTRVTSSLDGGAAKPVEMTPDFEWSAVFARRGNELLGAREMVVLVQFALSDGRKGRFETTFGLKGLAQAARWFEDERCR